MLVWLHADEGAKRVELAPFAIWYAMQRSIRGWLPDIPCDSLRSERCYTEPQV
jgi:hypothetical protein